MRTLAFVGLLGLGLAGIHIAGQRDAPLSPAGRAAAEVARASVPSRLDLWALSTVVEQAEGDETRQFLHLRVFTPLGQVPVFAALERSRQGWLVQEAGRTDLTAAGPP